MLIIARSSRNSHVQNTEVSEQMSHDTDSTTGQISTDHSDYIFFYGEKNLHGEFSNFYHCPKGFKVSAKDILGVYFTKDYKDEIFVKNSEQAIMWFKALLMHDIEIAKKIEGETKPFKCKQYGREVRCYNETLWSNWRELIATYVLTQKFTSCDMLKKKLLETGTATLVEASPRDRIWGIGISVEQAMNGHSWRGQNLLGKYLIQVRNTIVNNV